MTCVVAGAVAACPVLAGDRTVQEIPPGMRLEALPRRPAEPPDNPSTPDRIALGRLLFFDPILSATQGVACATCHHPAFGWTDGRPVPIGVGGAGLGPQRVLGGPGLAPPLTRNSLPILNTAFNGLVSDGKPDPGAAPMFWNSRTSGLEAQALVPIRSRGEMRGEICAEADAVGRGVERLQANAEYRRLFDGAFPETPGRGISAENLAKAVAAFERSLIATETPLDRYLRGDTKALDASQQRGLQVFKDAGCIQCHGGPMLSDFKLHFIGVTDAIPGGRSEFRTPSLRNLRRTAPYMHNGSLRTLEDVLVFYEQLSDAVSETLDGGDAVAQPPLDPLLKKLNLRPEDFPALLSFFAALEDPHYDQTVPASVPSGLPVAGIGTTSSFPPGRPRARPPSALTGYAQWEKGEELLKRIKVPPAPVRTAEEELRTFKLAPGYRAELVAAEPLVHNPIFFEFDPDGRIWVVEYQGYMRDLQGSGEGDPICRIVVLEDLNEDGRMDRSTVFLDNLVMPRSFAFVKGGILVEEPPHLWFCQDSDGDLKCDQRTEVGTMGLAGNPQHTANGLRRGIDNWLHCADWPKKYQWRDGKLVEQDTVHRGQFGLTFDETGRFFTCYENRALHADFIPADSLLRNRNLFRVFQRGDIDRSVFGVNVNISSAAQEVFPIRVTPAVTLGALELRDDGRLRTYTIASGVCCYDGHQFPPDSAGNVFVPESGGHLIGRLKLCPGIAPEAARFYPPELELLASTDERFRPVNARVGPDGALYIADLYHGIIEHVIFMVPWLSKQIRERGLDQGNDRGRIWRVVAENRGIDRQSPRLSRASGPELVACLSHPNGWHRLTAQRLLVERNDDGLVDILRKTAAEASEPLARLHALWTLDGVESLDVQTVLAALEDGDERVRAAAVRLCGRHATPSVLEALQKRLNDPGASVRLQLALTLAAFSGPRKESLLAALLARTATPKETTLLRSAALSSLEGRELEFLTDRVMENRPDSDPRTLALLLARCVLEEAVPGRVGALLNVLAESSEKRAWLRGALIDAFGSIRYEKPLALASEPIALSSLLGRPDIAARESALRALGQFDWPGAKVAGTLTQNAPALAPAQQQRVESGRQVYAAICAACHQLHGGGTPGAAPPLAGSDWVAGSPEKLARIVLHGLYGPVEVNRQTWNLHMPGLGASGILDDEKIAAVLSYVRRAWGNAAVPVEPSLIASVREEAAGRVLPWRAEELLQIGVAEPEDPPIKPAADGEVFLPASRARVYGQKLGYRPALDVLAPWRVKDDVAVWRCEISRSGDYEVLVTLAADDASAGDQFDVETEAGSVTGTVLSSGGYETFREVSAGRLSIKQGIIRMILRPHGPLKEELADVRGVRLKPVK